MHAIPKFVNYKEGSTGLAGPVSCSSRVWLVDAADGPFVVTEEISCAANGNGYNCKCAQYDLQGAQVATHDRAFPSLSDVQYELSGRWCPGDNPGVIVDLRTGRAPGWRSPEMCAVERGLVFHHVCVRSNLSPFFGSNIWGPKVAIVQTTGRRALSVNFRTGDIGAHSKPAYWALLRTEHEKAAAYASDVATDAVRVHVGPTPTTPVHRPIGAAWLTDTWALVEFTGHALYAVHLPDRDLNLAVFAHAVKTGGVQDVNTELLLMIIDAAAKCQLAAV